MDAVIIDNVTKQLGMLCAVDALSAKIFRTGILMYGKQPSPSEILKWLRYK